MRTRRPEAIEMFIEHHGRNILWWEPFGTSFKVEDVTGQNWLITKIGADLVARKTKEWEHE